MSHTSAGIVGRWVRGHDEYNCFCYLGRYLVSPSLPTESAASNVCRLLHVGWVLDQSEENDGMKLHQKHCALGIRRQTALGWQTVCPLFLLFQTQEDAPFPNARSPPYIVLISRLFFFFNTIGLLHPSHPLSQMVHLLDWSE